MDGIVTTVLVLSYLDNMAFTSVALLPLTNSTDHFTLLHALPPFPELPVGSKTMSEQPLILLAVNKTT